MQIPGNQTPIYKPSFPSELSPRAMWKEEVEKKNPSAGIVLPKPDPVDFDDYKEAYKGLSDDEKNLICAGIVLSNNWRKFLKPYLEGFVSPPRKPVQSDADYYELLNNNAVAAFAENLILTLEGRAKRSSAYEYKEEIGHE